jgi:hypothetical protein
MAILFVIYVLIKFVIIKKSFYVHNNYNVKTIKFIKNAASISFQV